MEKCKNVIFQRGLCWTLSLENKDPMIVSYRTAHLLPA